MKRILSILLCLLITLTALPLTGGSAVGAPDTPELNDGMFGNYNSADGAPDALYDGYIVKTSGVMGARTLSSAAEPLGGGLYRVDSPEEAATLGGTIEYIEPDYIIYELGDPISGYTPPQWSSAAIGMQAAWERGLFGEGVKVGLVDSGIRATHEDLRNGNILPVVNCTDDGQSIADATGHGTLVGGIIAAQVNNAQSPGSPAVDGGASAVTILPLRVFSQIKTATVSMAIAAINRAVSEGCDVINLSVGTTAFSTGLKEACDAAAAQGVLLVAAAGNWGGTVYGYPASFDSVISVAAVDQSHTRAYFSQYNDKVFVTAPGANIAGLGFSANNAYVTGKEGTSYSAPIVTAMAALAKEQNRAVTLDTFRQLLASTATDIGVDGRDNLYGYGMVNFTRYVTELTRDYAISYENIDALPNWPADATYKLNMSSALTLTTPVRAGYDFAGWYTDSQFTGEPIYTITPGTAGDMTLYAAWEESSLPAALSVRVGGIAARAETISHFTVTVPKDYIVTDSDFEISTTPSGAVVENLRYETDQWHFTVCIGANSADYTLTVTTSDNAAPTLKQGGTFSGTAAPASLDGLTAAVPFTLELSDYFADTGGETLSFNISPSGAATVEGGTLLYTPQSTDAHSAVTLTITAFDGEFNSPPLAVTVTVAARPVSRSTLGLTTASFDLYAPTAVVVPLVLYDNTLQSISLSGAPLAAGVGYTMRYAVTDGEDAAVLSAAALGGLTVGTHTFTFTFSAGAEATLQLAVSDSAPRYTVTFIAEGSTPFALHPNVRIGAAIPLPSAPVRSGYTFGGWYTGRDGAGTVFTAATPVTAAVTLYAKWTTSTPSGDGGGGGGGGGGGFGGGGADEEPEPVLFKLTATAGDGGSVSPSELEAEEGGTATFTVTPNVGYALSELRVDGKPVPLPSDVSAPYVYTFDKITAVHTLSASFVAVEEVIEVLEETPPPELLPVPDFSDVSETDWFYNAVCFVCERGLFVGVSDTDFAPDETVTRGMAVTVLWRLGGKPAATDSNDFTDVQDGEWFTEAVVWAAGSGITSGYGDGRFGPDDTLSREQLAVFLYRFAMQNREVGQQVNSLDGFTDASQVSDWAADALRWAVSVGLLTGKGNGILDPQGNATRAELAAILMRFAAAEA